MEYVHPNEPNAGRLAESLRHLGYGTVQAIADLVDNAIDADATEIHLRLTAHQDALPEIVIADNGVGMDRATLDQAMRLGSDTNRNNTTDLGFYGMGLVTASLSVARACHVITRNALGSCWSSAWDIDVIKERGAFVKHLAGATKDEEDILNSFVGSGKTGTLVILPRCDHLKIKSDSLVKSTLPNHLGRVFRQFLQGNARKLTMTINGVPVEPVDPLALNDPGTRIAADENIAVTVEDSSGKRTENVRVRIVELPDSPVGDTEIRRSLRGQGFYVMRNQREIKEAETFDFFTRHPDFNRVRGEIFLPGTLDRFAGIEFTKQEVKFEQSLSDQLGGIIKQTMRTLKANERLKRSFASSPAQKELHTQSAKAISAKDKLLLKPKVKSRVDEQGDTNPLSTNGRSGKPEQKTLSRTQSVETAFNCEIREERLGPSGQIYECEQLGRRIIIRYNVEHPFYQKFVVDNLNDNDGRMVTVADFLIYSMASAELRMGDEEQWEIVSNFKTDVANNLRTLLN